MRFQLPEMPVAIVAITFEKKLSHKKLQEIEKAIKKAFKSGVAIEERYMPNEKNDTITINLGKFYQSDKGYEEFESRVIEILGKLGYIQF